MTREEILNELYKITSDLVIVGGSSQLYFGKKDKAKDIDIVIKDFKPEFYLLGEVRTWYTESKFSKSGKRAFITRPDFCIDIFIEETLPTHICLNNGYKYETIDSMINFYRRLFYEYDPIKQWKQREEMKKKHNLISKEKL